MDNRTSQQNLSNARNHLTRPGSIAKLTCRLQHLQYSQQIGAKTVKSTRLIACAIATLFCSSAATAAPIDMKFGTLGPEGSPWINKWYELVDIFEATSPAPVKVVTYPGGVMGDEPDMVRKLKFGQLQMVGVTVSGIAQLMPEMLVLNIPFLFRNYDEVDYVMDKLLPRFQELAEKRGLYLIGVIDQGMIEAFSKKLVNSADEFIKQRVWIWNADQVGIMTAKAVDINSVMLPVPEVLTSLQTGLIDTMFSSTTALVSLQWHTQMKYFYRFKLRYDPAALFVSSKALNKFPADKREGVKKALVEAQNQTFRPFRFELRETEEEYGKMIIEAGIKEVTWGAESVKALEDKAKVVWDQMAGENYPPELLEEVKATLAEYRAQK